VTFGKVPHGPRPVPRTQQRRAQADDWAKLSPQAENTSLDNMDSRSIPLTAGGADLGDSNPFAVGVTHRGAAGMHVRIP
jgi:hypothetical protein